MRSPLLCMTWLSETGMRLGLRIWLIIKGDGEKEFQCLLLDVFVLKNSTEKEKFVKRIFYILPTSGAQMTVDRAIATGRETDGTPPAAGNSSRRIIETLRWLGVSECSELAAVQISQVGDTIRTIVIHLALDLVSYVRYLSRKRVNAGAYLH